MKVVFQKKTLISVISILVVSTICIGGYYFASNKETEIERGSLSIPTDRVYLPAYSEVGFLVESLAEGQFWRFETIRPVFQGYVVENGKSYIEAYFLTEFGIEVPVGIYVSGELAGIDTNLGKYEDTVWLRREYNIETFESFEIFGEELTFEELKENWNIEKGDQFEVLILVASPGEDVLEKSCLIAEFTGYCDLSYVSSLLEWNMLNVYHDGASFEPNGIQLAEIFPYFIGRTIE